MKAFNFKLYHLQVFIILMLALVLCSFLGGNCGIEGMTTIDHDHDVVTDKNNLLQDPIESKVVGNGGEVDRSTIKSNDSLKNQLSNATLNGTYIDDRPSISLAAVPKNSIPVGNEDLYVLRSEVASLLNKPSNTPCPPCGRCPEPSFSCKKVPNYNNIHSENNILPKPVLSDFSTFAM
jgi:hypothetical protein